MAVAVACDHHARVVNAYSARGDCSVTVISFHIGDPGNCRAKLHAVAADADIARGDRVQARFHAFAPSRVERHSARIRKFSCAHSKVMSKPIIPRPKRQMDFYHSITADPHVNPRPEIPPSKSGPRAGSAFASPPLHPKQSPRTPPRCFHACPDSRTTVPELPRCRSPTASMIRWFAWCGMMHLIWLISISQLLLQRLLRRDIHRLHRVLESFFPIHPQDNGDPPPRIPPSPDSGCRPPTSKAGRPSVRPPPMQAVSSPCGRPGSAAPPRRPHRRTERRCCDPSSPRSRTASPRQSPAPCRTCAT